MFESPYLVMENLSVPSISLEVLDYICLILLNLCFMNCLNEAYDMFACNGILSNPESPRRVETSVTRKITRFVAQISLGHRLFSSGFVLTEPIFTVFNPRYKVEEQ